MSVAIAGVELGDPQMWNHGGGRFGLSGLRQAGSTNEMGIARYQLEGVLANPDEASGVPVIVSSDTLLTGFYRVTGGGLDVRPDAYTGYRFGYDLDLVRVLPTSSPQIESTLLGALRTNSHSIASGSTVPWWATPADASMDYVAGATRSTRTCDAGSVLVNYTTDGTLLYDTIQVWQAAPGDFYDLAARFELTYDGSNWVRLPGLEVGTASASGTGWRLINDFVQVTYGGGNGLLSVRHNFGSGWTTAKIYRLIRGISPSSPTALGPFKGMRLLKNAPEEVVLRLSLEQDSTSYPAQVNVDLRLRRGALWVEGTVTRNPRQTSSAEIASTDFPLGIRRDTTEAGTSHTSGVHATSADAGGHKYVLTSPTATNVDTTNGGISQGTGVNTFEFMIGLEPSGASGPNTFTNQVYAYFANVHETQRLARR